MNESFRAILAVIGRVLLCAIFLVSAVMNDIPNFQKTVGMMASMKVPEPQILLPIAIVFLIVGSVSVVIGFKARFGVLLLFLFLIPATYFFHNPTGITDAGEQLNQINHLMKNVALMGAMLFIMANGAGPGSLDTRGKY
jgi:putative oxidoreductase